MNDIRNNLVILLTQLHEMIQPLKMLSVSVRAISLFLFFIIITIIFLSFGKGYLPYTGLYWRFEVIFLFVYILDFGFRFLT